jgi:excisionase family DNA binding protein
VIWKLPVGHASLNEQQRMDIHRLPITLSPRPKLRDIPALAMDHDIFLTLLLNEENPQDIGQEVKKTGKLWWHCPFSVLVRYQKKYDYNLLIFTIEKLCQAVIAKKRIFIHCDAGIDRTGTVTLATLICLGLKKREATEFLISKQPEAVKRLHWDYVDRLVASIHEARRKSGINPNYRPMLERAYSLINSAAHLLTRYELASLLRSSPHTVKQWLRDRAIPAIKEGPMWQIEKEDLNHFKKSKTYLENQGECPFFPWHQVNVARADHDLQSRHSIDTAKSQYHAEARPCPKCDTPPDQLTWIYFRSPEGTWAHKCGRAGWLVVCDSCRIQTDFFLELMS